MSALLFVPLILFVTIVAPLWLVLHYVTRWRQSKTLSSEDEKMLLELWQSAQRMEARIETLETILDADAPGWRRRET
ncbi:MAG: envelope stress response membrane protein PspB [Azospirillaceae bacterium]